MISEQKRADAHAREIGDQVRSLQADNPNFCDLRDALNAFDVPTLHGGRWHVGAVHALCERLGVLGL